MTVPLPVKGLVVPSILFLALGVPRTFKFGTAHPARISMVAKSKDPSQAPRLAYDSNHNTTHYNDASYRRFPELSTDCSETQYELSATKYKKQLFNPDLNFDEEYQKPVQLLNFTLNGALPDLGYSAGMHIVPAYIAELCISSPLTFFAQAHPSSTRYIKVTRNGNNNSNVRLDRKVFDNGPISMAAKSKDPSQVAMPSYDSNHNFTHYNDASYRRFPELSTDFSETLYLLNITKSKKQLLGPALNFDEEYQKPVQLPNFTHYGALP